jgi:lysophospholipid acyltransferase (LPLAT)-like uncharacterized protein
MPPAPKPNHVVVPRRLKWRHHVAAFFIFAGLQVLSWTWRCRFVDAPGFLNQPHGPVIFCLWHNRLGLSMTMWKWVGRTKIHTAGLAALISASHDGGVLARALRYFNVETVRGSSSRRGAQAMLELTSIIERGYCVAITPMARAVRGCDSRWHHCAGSPPVAIVPLRHVRWKLTLKKSWDRFQVPPHLHCETRIGSRFGPRDATDAERLSANCRSGWMLTHERVNPLRFKLAYRSVGA